jgi:hypothetical protein
MCVWQAGVLYYRPYVAYSEVTPSPKKFKRSQINFLLRCRFCYPVAGAIAILVCNCTAQKLDDYWYEEEIAVVFGSQRVSLSCLQ